MVQAAATTRDRRTAWRNTPDSRFSCGRIACQVFFEAAGFEGGDAGVAHAVVFGGGVAVSELAELLVDAAEVVEKAAQVADVGTVVAV